MNTMTPQDMQRVTEGLHVLLAWLKRSRETKSPQEFSTDWEALPEVLQISEIAQILNISKGKAYYLCKRSDFPAVRIGRRILVRKDLLKIWLDKQIVCNDGRIMQ